MTAQPYISRTTFLVQFEVDTSIRFKLGEIERAFQSVCQTQGVSTNVPDSAPAAIPRITLQSGPKSIAVSQVTTQLDMDFSEQRKSVRNTFDILQKNVELFWTGVMSFKSTAEIGHAGLVVTVASPSQLPKGKICASILDRYAKIPNRGESAQASIQFGYLDAEHHMFNNVAISNYEMRSGAIEMGSAKRLQIDVSSLPLKEEGVEIKFDFNSRPMGMSQVTTPPDLAQLLIRSMQDCVFGWSSDFIKW